MRQRQGAGGRWPRARRSWVLLSAFLALLAGCARAPDSPPADSASGDSPSVASAAFASAPAHCGLADSAPDDSVSFETAPVDFAFAVPDPGEDDAPWLGHVPPCISVPVFEAGREVGHVCPEAARREGLTIVDLSDDWVPLALRDPEDDAQPPQPYRATYVALSNEEFPPGPEGDRARHDAFLELYGIFPTFRVVAGRLLDEERHLCNAAVDLAPVQALTTSPQPSSVPVTPPVTAAFAALDERLVCERLLPAPARRRPAWRLQEALEAFQRKHMVVSRGLLDGETRRALAQDSRELDFRTLLRILRARVVDATGLIEDGTALAARGVILSRRVDGDAFYANDEYDAVEGGAPDLISPATEAAAQAMGWTDPRAAASFFQQRGPQATHRLRVALRLPRAPAYHSEHMELAVEIDRGDVWYELPTRRGPIAHRPTLTLYARTSGGEEVALVRWPTTIGGWKKEQGPRGRVGLRYKNSDVGKRLWRDLVVSPAWLPPPQTPARALVQRAYGPAKWLPETDLVHPGYPSAYGLVMLVHHRLVESAAGAIWYDNGIRTHGSVNYHSILRSESHGCHRLFNDAAVQLASFLLRHRRHVPRGVLAKPFTHEFTWRGIKLKLAIPHRGYWFELTPPVDVEVLRGTVRGRIHRVPLRLVRLPRTNPLAQAPGGATPDVRAAGAPAKGLPHAIPTSSLLR